MYVTEAILPLEITSRSLRVIEFDVNTNEVELYQDLDILNENWEVPQLCQAAYKAHTENFYNMRVRVRNFKVEEWVLRKNDSSHGQP